jgi:hypothetical protein
MPSQNPEGSRQEGITSTLLFLRTLINKKEPPMQEMPVRSAYPGRIEKVTGRNSGKHDPIASPLAAILNTREVRELLANILPEVLETIGGDKKGKKYVFRWVGNYLRKSLSRPQDVLRQKQLQSLLEDEHFIDSIVTSFPSLLDNLFQTMNTLMGSMNDIYVRYPEFFSDRLGAGVDKWVEETDFAELKACLENSFRDLTGLLNRLNNSMFERPAKVVLLMALVPPLANFLLTGLNDTVRRFNDFPPDLVADAMLSLFREVDSKTMGALFNEVIELGRKLNVGSALTGQTGQPQFRMDLRKVMQELLGEIDEEVLCKFREAWAQGKETVNYAMTHALKSRPEIVMHHLRTAPSLQNYKYRILKNKLNLLDSLPEEQILDALTSGFSRIDGDSLAEVMNITASLVNRIRDRDSTAIRKLFDEVVNSLDMHECEEAVKGLIDDIGASLKPVGNTLLPYFIQVLAGEWMQTEDDDNKEDLESARAAIIQFLNHKELPV